MGGKEGLRLMKISFNNNVHILNYSVHVLIYAFTIYPFFVHILNVNRFKECEQRVCTEKHSIYLCLYVFVHNVHTN